MKVFYVMVLVLVAGAVPSHGRTESEGTLFNKTQPHESWNNVTVSSSKLMDYDYLYLAMQWPRSFCNSINHIPCYNQQVPGRFIVHGLWPQSGPPIYRGVDCTSRPIYGRFALFNSRQLLRSLEPSLNTHWPDLTTSESNNQCFWGSEYNKHGSCTFSDQNEYFDLTLKLVKDLGDLNMIFRIGGGRSIIPGKGYQPGDIIGAVRRVTSKIPRLYCVNVGNSIQLLEIRLCADRHGNKLNLIDCPPPPVGTAPDCWNREVILPPA